MIILNVIPYDNHAGLEATWLERIQAPNVDIAATPAVFDENGVEIEPATEARTEPGQITDTQIKCHSYAACQMDMFRADIAEFGGDAAEFESLIAGIEAAYVPPPVEPTPVPALVSVRQGKLALLDAGLLDDVEAVVAQADRATQIEWEYATEWRRDWPTLRALQAALGWSDAQVDALFIAASQR